MGYLVTLVDVRFFWLPNNPIFRSKFFDQITQFSRRNFPPENWVIWSKEIESEHAQKVPSLKFGISIIVLNNSLKYLLISEVNIFHFMKTSLQFIFLNVYKFKVDLKEYFDFA